MKKHLGIMLTLVALLTLAGCGSHNTSSAKKAVGHSFTSTKKAKTASVLKGRSFSLKSGTLVVTDAHNLSITAPAVSGGKLAAVVVEGSVTNKSKKPITADSFFNQNFVAKQVSDDSVSPLQASSALQVETKYNKAIEAGISSKIKPGKTGTFAIAWQFSSPKMLTSKIVVEANASGKHASADLALKPKAEALTIGKTQSTAKSSSSASSAVTASSSSASSASSASSTATAAGTTSSNGTSSSNGTQSSNSGRSTSNYYTPRSSSRYTGTSSTRSNGQYSGYYSNRSRTSSGTSSTQRSTSTNSGTNTGSSNSGYGTDADDAEWYDPTQTSQGE
ncbi:DUF5067 domain-containing protein [Lacticaseibacillus zhaodongensis]|uniref:DUF5067 domain-containing protein n=1 Tax=Lacticaseibacillus zhaodongensis TaxID=2668065 RepID=UPI0012D31779|nr:DUF5067 domain-containing protein [Lacticaseibacillus zhaodongensis]